MLALLRGSGWRRTLAAERARELAAASLETAAREVRRGRLHDERTRAFVERAIRRLDLVADLESGVMGTMRTWMVRRGDDASEQVRRQGHEEPWMVRRGGQSKEASTMQHMDRYGYLVARIMLASLFLLTGFDKLVDIEDAAGDIAEIGLPFPRFLAVVVGLVELVCGAALVVGWRAGWAAVGLLGFLVTVTLLMENPLIRPEGATWMDFLRNVPLMGGMLLVVLSEYRSNRWP